MYYACSTFQEWPAKSVWFSALVLCSFIHKCLIGEKWKAFYISSKSFHFKVKTWTFLKLLIKKFINLNPIFSFCFFLLSFLSSAISFTNKENLQGFSCISISTLSTFLGNHWFLLRWNSTIYCWMQIFWNSMENLK